MTRGETPVTRADYRVTYWTGWLSPGMEGSSKEVFALKDHFRRSSVVGLSRHYELRASIRRRYFGLNVRWYALFRLLAPPYERSAQINHVYGSIADWFFLRVLRRRPIVMTVATEGACLDRSMYHGVRRFVAHAPGTVEELVRLGFDRATVRIIYPGVDLRRFRPAPRVASGGPWREARRDRFRVLFATSPNWTDGIEQRGVTLLVAAASRLPDVDFWLLWRPLKPDRGAGLERVKQQIRTGALDNVVVSIEQVADMASAFHAVDATTAPFLQSTGMKICPTSLVESLACGRPILVSTQVGIADLVRTEECGEVFEPTVNAFCQAVQRLRADYQRLSDNARRTAERHFDIGDCLRRHEDLYGEVLTCRA